MPPVSPLFTPTRLGRIDFGSRVVMAPMTRNRANPDGTATASMATYYAQRASAGLIVAEMTWASPDGIGYPNTPGIATDAHVDAWRRVTRAVHAAGGRIVLQIAHAGRISHPSLQPDGRTPVSASAVRPDGQVFTPTGPQDFVTPRALEVPEIEAVVRSFGDATARARAAGFDGVELHGANGYLLDQFLRSGANRRTDAYGGSAAARGRLLVEAATAAASAWDPARVGVRLSPFSPFNSMSDADPRATFPAVAARLGELGLAFLHVIEGEAGDERLTPALRAAFGGPIIANLGYDRASAERALMRGEADAVSFGAPYVANPDLAERLRTGAPLNEPDRATFYGGGDAGYVDYPMLPAAERAA